LLSVYAIVMPVWEYVADCGFERRHWRHGDLMHVFGPLGDRDILPLLLLLAGWVLFGRRYPLPLVMTRLCVAACVAVPGVWAVDARWEGGSVAWARLGDVIVVAELVARAMILIITCGVLTMARNSLAGPMASAGPNSCPGCGYCLLGLPDSRCPECGRAFQPADTRTTAFPSRRRTRWLAFRISVALAAGVVISFAYPTLLVRSILGDDAFQGPPDLRLNYLQYRPVRTTNLLVDALDAKDASRRGNALSCLCFIGAPSARLVPRLVEMAEADPDEGNRIGAVLLLAQIDPHGLISAYEMLLRRNRESVAYRDTLVVVLGGRAAGTDDRAIPILLDALGDPNATVRADAYDSLKACTGQSLPFTPRAPAQTRQVEVQAWVDWWQQAVALGIEKPD